MDRPTRGPAAWREALHPTQQSEGRAAPAARAPQWSDPERKGSGGARPSDAAAQQVRTRPRAPRRHPSPPSTFPQQLGTTVPRGAAAARPRHPCVSLRLRLGPPLPPGGDGRACRCPCDLPPLSSPLRRALPPRRTGSFPRPERQGCLEGGRVVEMGTRPSPNPVSRCGYLVDPASSICLSQRLSHARVSTHGRYSETANGSLNQLWFL